MTRTIKCSSKYFDIDIERKEDYVRYTVLFLCLSTKIELVYCVKLKYVFGMNVFAQLIYTNILSSERSTETFQFSKICLCLSIYELSIICHLLLMARICQHLTESCKIVECCRKLHHHESGWPSFIEKEKNGLYHLPFKQFKINFGLNLLCLDTLTF